MSFISPIIVDSWRRMIWNPNKTTFSVGHIKVSLFKLHETELMFQDSSANDSEIIDICGTSLTKSVIISN
jgi:hypothetical protein